MLGHSKVKNSPTKLGIQFRLYNRIFMRFLKIFIQECYTMEKLPIYIKTKTMFTLEALRSLQKNISKYTWIIDGAACF